MIKMRRQILGAGGCGAAGRGSWGAGTGGGAAGPGEDVRQARVMIAVRGWREAAHGDLHAKGRERSVADRHDADAVWNFGGGQGLQPDAV